MDTPRLKGLALIAVLLAAAATAFAAGGREPSGAMMQKVPEGAMMAKETAPAWRVEFTTIEDAEALAADVPVVLFFTADWCPTCKAALRDLDANGAKLGDRRIVLVDYDREAGLKKRYDVTYQHTWVWIDAKGTALETWNGGGVDGILDRVMPAKATM